MAASSRLEQITAMLQDEPNDPELRYMLAMEHVSGGNDAEAVRCFEELMRRCPDYPPGFHMAARALLRLLALPPSGPATPAASLPVRRFGPALVRSWL